MSGTEAEAFSAALAPLGAVEAHPDGISLLTALSRAERPPELIVLAEDGPGLDRLEQLSGIQGLFGSAAPPVLVVVEPEREDLLARALERGASDAILRPWRAADLVARARARAKPPVSVPRPRVLDARLVYESLARSVTSHGGALFGLRLIVSELSQSPLTRVFKGLRLVGSGELCAIKILDPEVAAQDEDWAGRFAREQSVLLGLEHPNLVPIRDAGTLDGLAYLDMDFVAGVPLDRRLSEGPCTTAEALRIAVQIGRGLGALHERGIVHRDVKPENVILDLHGDARLCDFGLSKAHDDSGLTREGEILGTAAFIAPETLCGSQPSYAGDVYALGITLYELLTGEEAISGPPDAAFRAAVSGEPQRQALRTLPAQLRPVVGRMLAVDPDDRYDRLSDLVRDLEACGPA
ncbi:MAG: protein kinase [Planctomycetes bacterium]|nr:protein kinase [Planctomycetota bacterium]